MALLKIEHLKKTFENVTPIEDLSLEVNDGDVISVIGPSGTGKSTLLRCINQLTEPTSGTVIFDGEVITDPNCDIAKVRQKMGMVFQSFNLFADLTIIENIIVAPMKLLKKSKEEAAEEGMRLLKRIGLEDKANQFPDTLSGGQKQRVAIARAVAMKPKILLFDEPTSALDPTMISEVLGLIRALANDGMTMMVVTHEMKFARDVSTRVLYLDEGGIYEDGTPEQIFEHPEKEKTRKFIKRLRTMELNIDSSSNFDFYGVLSTIEDFGRLNMLSPKKVMNLQLIFEEMMQIITSHMEETGEKNLIHFGIEHSESTGQTKVAIVYGGEEFSPLTDNENLSVKLVKGFSLKAEHRYNGAENNVEFILG